MAQYDVVHLGNHTVAAALAASVESAIAQVTGLGLARVRRVLNETHGKTLVRNAFADEWPMELDPETIDEIGSATVASALSAELEAEIAAAVGLPVAKVRRELHNVHGKTLVRNVFPDEWPDDSQPESQSEYDFSEDAGPSAVGEWLNKTRVLKGYSVPDLANRAGVSTATIYFIESGRNQNPRRETLNKLERALGGTEVDPLARRTVQEESVIEGLGAFTDFNPHDDADLPNAAGVYVFYDISQRPIYVGTSDRMRMRIHDHKDKFWFKEPIVETGSYVEISDRALRKQVETLLIKFLKSNAVLNKQNVDRS